MQKKTDPQTCPNVTGSRIYLRIAEVDVVVNGVVKNLAQLWLQSISQRLERLVNSVGLGILRCLKIRSNLFQKNLAEHLKLKLKLFILHAANFNVFKFTSLTALQN